MDLVAMVFSLKIKTSCSPQRSTSDITKSVRKSWQNNVQSERKQLNKNHTLKETTEIAEMLGTLL